jgi:hypothetical protein
VCVYKLGTNRTNRWRIDGVGNRVRGTFGTPVYSHDVLSQELVPPLVGSVQEEENEVKPRQQGGAQFQVVADW